MTKNPRQKFKYLENKTGFLAEMKNIFHHFKGLSLKLMKQIFLEGESLTLKNLKQLLHSETSHKKKLRFFSINHCSTVTYSTVK